MHNLGLLHSETDAFYKEMGTYGRIIGKLWND